MAGSTIPRRAFGRFLRGLRERAGVTLLTAGLEIDTSKQTILRLEDGQPTKVSTPQLKSLLDLYKVRAVDRAEALELWEDVKQQAKAAKLQGIAKGWWQAYSDQYAPHFDHYLRLEASADRLTTHQLVLVHGLVQTPRYRRAIIEATHPDLASVDVDRRLELAARRQERLADSGFSLEILISEAVLRHQVGGHAVMAEQLRHLVDVDARENVSIRVVPFSASTHAGLISQSFTLLEFPPLAIRLVEPPVVYMEGSEGALYLEQDRMIGRFRQSAEGLRQVALNQQDTRDMVSAVAKEYEA
ncbi:helix-turn-helix transcriptional regulator [Nocardia sp. NPDC051030]|uniref:helix-turn-helix domain-containing protein n=1 Tax=Nocardia sp. NPDC051030 TaxID=3155162 RepID=UPI00341DAAF2